MNTVKTNKTDTRKIAGLGLFTAIVIILQAMGSFVKLGPFSISLVLIPIVLGAALYGRYAGTWLGFVFGLAVLISGDAGPFLAVNPIGTVITVLFKGMACGFATGVVYSLLVGKNRTVAVIISALVCPVVNTGVFLIGCLIFFMDIIAVWAEGLGMGDNVGLYMIVGLVGVNFIAEVLINIVLSPVIFRLLDYVKKSH